MTGTRQKRAPGRRTSRVATRQPRVADQKSATVALISAGADFHRRGWSLGTSGNASVLLSRRPFRLLVTASGRDKGNLVTGDFTIVDETGMPADARAPRPSAETLLHLAIMLETGANSVLHTHSVWNTLLSDIMFATRNVPISGYEMLKALDGVTTHDTTVNIEIFENSQNMIELSEQVRSRLTGAPPLRHGFLIRGHGLYTWGRDVHEARRHVEALEFLFEVVGRTMNARPPITKM